MEIENLTDPIIVKSKVMTCVYIMEKKVYNNLICMLLCSIHPLINKTTLIEYREGSNNSSLDCYNFLFHIPTDIYG